ncbi:hypothetical protein [Aureimonas populi]|uniref:Uncharacterized protein n=1 Tax=Aureimonas populi TaxID=1701758 RepID=A0ABW5CHE2_9HYPH|nr:hypothetical protein [Aureimonas populi]
MRRFIRLIGVFLLVLGFHAHAFSVVASAHADERCAFVSVPQVEASDPGTLSSESPSASCKLMVSGAAPELQSPLATLAAEHSARFEGAPPPWHGHGIERPPKGAAGRA